MNSEICTCGRPCAGRSDVRRVQEGDEFDELWARTVCWTKITWLNQVHCEMPLKYATDLHIGKARSTLYLANCVMAPQTLIDLDPNGAQ